MKAPFDEIPADRPPPRRSLGFANAAGFAVALAIGALAWTSRPNQPIREGVVEEVRWLESAGAGRAYARSNGPMDLPGTNGSGSGGMKMHGRLLATHLELTFERSPGRRVYIPTDRLVTINFLDEEPVDASTTARPK